MRVAGDAEGEAHRASAARAAGRLDGVEEYATVPMIGERDGCDHPGAVCPIDPHGACSSPRLGQRRAHPAEKFVRFHAMRGVVRAGIHATGLGKIGAQIAGSGFLLDHGHLAARVHRIVLASP